MCCTPYEFENHFAGLVGEARNLIREAALRGEQAENVFRRLVANTEEASSRTQVNLRLPAETAAIRHFR